LYLREGAPLYVHMTPEAFLTLVAGVRDLVFASATPESFSQNNDESGGFDLNQAAIR
jgi:hypothetical protein